MKKLLLLLSLTLFLASCSDDNDKKDDKIPVTVDEIQGTWASAKNRNFYQVSFTGNKYVIVIMDSRGKTSREYGTFSINKLTTSMTTDEGKESLYNGGEIYWETHSKNILHLWSLGGDFQKTE